MFKHLLTLIWNKKKQNLLMIAEVLISFLVIFALSTLIVFYYLNYRKPLGLEYENVWVVSYSNPLKTENGDSLKLFYKDLLNTVEALPQVKKTGFCSNNIPFYQNTWSGSLKGNGKEINNVDNYWVDENYQDVLHVKLISGRWFTKDDVLAKQKPILINQKLEKELFGKQSALGKLVDEGNRKIIGVVEDVKAKGDYSTPKVSMYMKVDTGSWHFIQRLLVKVSPNADAAFEGRLYKTIAGMMKNSNLEIEHLVDKRKSINYFSLVPMIVSLIVAVFLIINVALGLFGVLWYNINKRRGEIGLRRAIGATGKSVSSQLVSESMILATLSLVIGTFFAIQFPLLDVFDLPKEVYLIALVLSILFIYLLVFICSLYPGKQAAAIYPAVALHEE
ncbi:MAG: ABC transporter permease [Bacteroidetes bacterium]|nr:ABC transporter permease [Bacteroidota bacterium]